MQHDHATLITITLKLTPPAIDTESFNCHLVILSLSFQLKMLNVNIFMVKFEFLAPRSDTKMWS